MTHTPTPWKLSEHAKWYIIGKDGQSVGSCGGESCTEDAAFIVHACNAHDELVDNLTEMLTLFAPQHTIDQTVEGEVDGTLGGAAVTRARKTLAALAKAEGN